MHVRTPFYRTNPSLKLDRSLITAQTDGGKKKCCRDQETKPQTRAAQESPWSELHSSIYGELPWPGNHLRPARQPISQHRCEVRSVEHDFFEDRYGDDR